MGDELFLQIDQIIPTPEAKEFMIGISAKNQESKKVEKEIKSKMGNMMNMPGGFKLPF